MSKRILLDLDRAVAPQLAGAAEAIRHGGLIVYPTDTFYALGADPFQTAAVDRIFTVKGRPPDKPLLVLMAEKDQARTCARVDVPSFELLADAFWPGPLTIVLPSLDRLPHSLTAGTGKVGIRLPGALIAREIVGCCGGMLTGTSANLSGMSDPSQIDRIDDAVHETVDFIIDAGPTPGRMASTIIDLTGPRPVIIRQGAVPQRDIERILGTPINTETAN